MRQRLWLLVAAVAAVGLVQLSPAAERLDNQLTAKMDDVVAGLKKKYKTVGVLRFRVQEGDGKVTFTSPLSGRMVDRIETLLIVHNSDREDKALSVVREVAQTAAAAKVGNWFSEAAERKKLFAHQYPMAWGSKMASVDAFLTGKVTLSKDGKHTTVALEAFDKSDLTPRKVATIEMETDRFVLRDLGYSWAVPRGSRPGLAKARSMSDEDQTVVKDGLNQNQDRRQQSQPDRKGKTQLPQASPSDIGGIKFELLADDKEVVVRPNSIQDTARWLVECPPSSAKVAMRLRNTSDKRLAVVLAVNGRSTINEQNVPPEAAAKWVIDPGKSYLIKGMYDIKLESQSQARGKGLKRNDDGLITQTEDKTTPPSKDQPTPGGLMAFKPFKVIVGDKADAMKSQLGVSEGWIDIDVFEQGSPKDSEPMITLKGLPPSSEKAARATYSGLRSAMLKSSQLKVVVKEEKKDGLIVKRSMIVPDDDPKQGAENIKVTNFPNSQFVARVTIKVTPNDAPPSD